MRKYLKDVSVKLPKHQLTMFTPGVGSYKSSLVFGTVATESRRLINEAYSAFVRDFVTALTRPEVDGLGR
jgi:excinuclease UvrABC ATPase subunit